MVSADEVDGRRGGAAAAEEVQMGRAGSRKLGDHIPIFIPTLEDGLLDEAAPRQRRFLDFLKAHPSRDWFLKFGLSGRFAPFSFLRRGGSQRDGSSSRPSTLEITSTWRRRFRVSFVRKVRWEALERSGKDWIRNPANMAFLLWLAAVTAVLFIMLLVVGGALNDAIPESSQRKKWVEITNQILNALFAVMCLYQQPKLLHHAAALLRWTPKDAAEMRQAYAKKAAPRPHERVHMAAVVALLNITCFAQYALCGLYWAYKRSERPEIGENLCIGVGVAAPVIAALYTLFGPLGRKARSPEDEESRGGASSSVETELAAAAAAEAKGFPRRVVVTRPQWVGGLFDCWDDMPVAYLSFFCTFCVFGWNMERLGFGNMYVHIFTFVLFVVAPFLVFNAAGLNINDDDVREFVGILGILLCFLGLLYGGFWRIRMRKKFRLPSSRVFCGQPNVADCLKWLFCWSCALAQEVRTVNFYDVEDDSFYSKQSSSSSEETSEAEEERGGGPAPQHLPREARAGPVIRPDLEAPVVVLVGGHQGRSTEGSPKSPGENTATPATATATTAPVPPLMEVKVEGNSPRTAER